MTGPEALNLEDGDRVLPVDDLLRLYMAPAVAAIARKIEGDLLDLYAGFIGKDGPA